MSWDLIHIVRRTYQGSDQWGDMYLRSINGEFERLCFCYELPWKEFQSGTFKGKSMNNLSRIKIGTYDLKSRIDGPKGWRLELNNTGHRKNIQIHRAHSSMFIQGCILPLSFNNLSENKLTKGDPVIQTQSVGLMNKIKLRYEALKSSQKGNPSVTIAATLPPKLFVKGSQLNA